MQSLRVQDLVRDSRNEYPLTDDIVSLESQLCEDYDMHRPTRCNNGNMNHRKSMVFTIYRPSGSRRANQSRAAISHRAMGFDPTFMHSYLHRRRNALTSDCTYPISNIHEGQHSNKSSMDNANFVKRKDLGKLCENKSYLFYLSNRWILKIEL